MRTPSATTSDFLLGCAATRRRSLGLGCLVLITVVGLIGTAPPALAVTEGHVYSFSFGSEGTGNGQFGFAGGVAVDQSTGDVYASDFPNSRIEKFDSAGNFLAAWGYGVLNGSNESQVCEAPATCHVGLSGAAPGQLEGPRALAVDNSGGPNDGDVYVTDTGLQVILKFSSDGAYLGKIDGAESPGGPFGELGSGAAMDVDGKGRIYVTTGRRVLKFDAGAENEYVGGSEWQYFGLFTLAVNSAGTKLMVNGYHPTTGNEAEFFINSNGGTPGPPLPCYFGGVARFDASTGFFLVSHGGSVCEIDPSGKQAAEPFGGGILAGVTGIAVKEAADDVYVADGSHLRVFVKRVVPDITTGAATDVAHTTATLTGQVASDPSAGGDVGECYFQYMSNEQLESLKQIAPIDLIFEFLGTKAPCKEGLPISSSTSVSADVTGLEAEKKYAYRLLAANSIDAARGAIRTFTPHWVLGLSTDQPTEVEPTTATLTGSFDPAGAETHYYFEWGPTTSYGNTTADPPGIEADPTPGVQQVFAPLTGLAANHVYHYRLVAENGLGVSYGDDVGFRTAPPPLPEIGESAADEVTGSTAHFSAAVNPNLGATIYRFQYGLDTSYGIETPVSESIGSDDVFHPVETDISHLTPGTTYHFRVVATNFGGTTLGPDVMFKTVGAPILLEASASDVGTTSAVLHAQVDPSLSPTTLHFEFGPGVSYGRTTAESAPIGSDEAFHLVSARVDGLSPGVTYHFRLIATNSIGESVGTDQTFVTASQPVEPPPPPTHCKRGFVKRHGKCVKRRHRRPHPNRHHHRGGRG